MALTGTMVRPPMACGGTSRLMIWPFLLMVVPFKRIRTVVLPFTAVMVWLTPFHSTVAPKASNIARNGTRVRPLRATAG